MLGNTVALLSFEQDFSNKFTDDNPSSEEYITVKLPFSIPYQRTVWENTKQDKGLYQYRNKFYNIVEQRLLNDTLYTVLKSNNTAQDRFSLIAQKIQAEVGNDATDSSSDVGKILKKFIKDYSPNFKSCSVFFLIWDNPLPIAQTLILWFRAVPLQLLTPPPQN